MQHPERVTVMAKIEGLKELNKKLAELGDKLGGKTLRQAAMNATTPAFRKIKAAAPVGSRAHRTYKGRLVAPGFLKRNIKRKSRYKGGRASVAIGVSAEAFYGVSFLDGGTRNTDARPWFKRNFINSQREMEKRLASELRRKILRIAAK